VHLRSDPEKRGEDEESEDQQRGAEQVRIVSQTRLVGSPGSPPFRPHVEHLCGPVHFPKPTERDQGLSAADPACAAQGGERGEDQLGLPQTDARMLDHEPSGPPGGRRRVAVRLGVEQEQADGEGLGETDARELRGRGADEQRVAGLQRMLEAAAG